MRVLDVTGHAADIFYVLLLYSGEYNFLPELYEILGQEKTVQLLDIFAGTEIRFPPSKELHRLAAEVQLYLRIKNAKSPKMRALVIHDLADQNQVTEDAIRGIYEKTKKVIEGKLGMEVLDRGKKRRFRIND